MWSCTVSYCVPEPRMYQGLFSLLASSRAPVTGVPALPTVPALTRRLAKVCGWPLLSVWLALSHQDQSPDRLPTDMLVCQARVGGREGAVHHVGAFDLVGADHAPARREGQPAHAVAQEVRQQDAVGVDGRARAVAGARGAAGEDCVVVVADVALAHQQAGEVLEHVFAVGGVDGARDLVTGDAVRGGGDLRGQRGGARGGHGDDAELLGVGVVV